ncbi:NAD(P)-binding protein [Schizopora paradoxa]|uniref:NAD(P)-binding protein n=1 Tax=Schizopora paradoxa TaxID=27342 RepID=A0A0H2RQQ4_9AGAM|nr:NAD(P)-binding protein [Schizopora paradoxa]
MATKSILLLGATGYIGGSLLVDLKKTFPDVTITTPTRSNSSAAALSAVGATPVVLDAAASDYHAKISALASKADVVISAADSDDLPLAEAVLKGLKKHKEETGKVATLVHTSGVAIFFDETEDGTYKPNGHFYDDLNEDDIKAITAEMPHGHVDVPILKAGEEGFVNTYIICPGAVNGAGWGPVSKASIYFKFVGGTMAGQKTAFKVGEASNVFGFVNIKDLVSLYVTLVGKVVQLDGKSIEGSPYSRYYIATAESVPFKTIVSLLAPELHKRGALPKADIASFTYEQLGPLGKLIAANTLVKPNRARKEFGWEPKHPNITQTIVDDVNGLLPALA